MGWLIVALLLNAGAAGLNIYLEQYYLLPINIVMILFLLVVAADS